MSLRRAMQWFVRGVILAGLIAFGVGVWYAQTWVSPEQVLAAVESSLHEQFPDSAIHVQSARLSVFGGVTVTDISVTRPGESEPFFAAPAALISHDKEGLNHGRLSVRKIELERPTFRIICGTDGVWKLPGLGHPSSPDQVVPTLIVRDATVIITDQRPTGFPEIRVDQAKFQFVNDPLPVLKVQGQAHVAPFGLVSITAQFNRESKAAAVRIELPDVTVNPAFAKELGRFKPEIVETLTGITAKASLKADIQYQPGTSRPVRSELKLDIRDGRFEDSTLPWPAEQITAGLTLTDGKLKIEKATAKMGPTTLELACETQTLIALSSERFTNPELMPKNDDSIASLENKFVSLTATIKNVPLGDELFSRMPPRADVIRKSFNPSGTIDLTYRFGRSNNGWKRDLEVRPNRLTVAFEQFKMPLNELDGTIRKTTASDGQVESDEVNVRLTGTTGGKHIDILGRVVGNGDDPFIDLRVSGDDIALNDGLFDAIQQDKPRKLLKKLHIDGRADFVATVRKDFGMNRMETIINVTAKDGRVSFERFPYPLEKVSGKVVVKVITSDQDRLDAPGSFRKGDPNPDRIELVGFTGMHGTGQVWLNGKVEEAKNSRDQLCILEIKAKDCPIDDSFAKALDAIKMGEVNRTFRPSGLATLGANVAITERANAPVVNGETEFDPDRDLVLAVDFKGPSGKPTFFPYEFVDVAGAFRYQNRKVDLLDFKARHGASRLSFDFGEVRFQEDGAIWAKLGRMAATPLVADNDLVAALPPQVRQSLIEAKPRGPMDLQVKELVVLVPNLKSTKIPEPESVGSVPTIRGQAPVGNDPKYGDPAIYWDGQLKLAGASIDAGTAWTEIVGIVACRGRYDGDHLAGVIGNVWLETASIFKQPVNRVKASFIADPQILEVGKTNVYQPIRVRLTDLQGRFFRGEIGGEAQLILADPPRFRVSLTAQDVRLEEFAIQNQLGKETELSGIAQGKLYLEHEPDPKTGLCQLQGSGSVDVPQGRLYKLPVLLELVKLAKLHSPDQTGFEEAHATFRIRGDRVYFDKLDLLGNAISLGGSGELDTDARDVKFEFYTIWSQTLKRWLTTPLGDPTSALSEKLFRIDAVRTNGGDFTYTPRMVPIVTDPFRAVTDRVKQRMGMKPDPVIRAVGGP